MKHLTSTLAVAALLVGSAFAGPYGSAKSSKGVIPPPPPPPPPAGCDAFDAGSQALSLFGAGIFPDSDLDDEWGGGIGYEFFFTENIGIAAAYTLFATDPEIHNITADLVFRLPIKSLCLAPYVLGGGGVHTNSATEAIGRLGAGVDVRFPSLANSGIFADWSYNWTGGDVEDYQIVRAGIKFAF